MNKLSPLSKEVLDANAQWELKQAQGMVNTPCVTPAGIQQSEAAKEYNRMQHKLFSDMSPEEKQEHINQLRKDPRYLAELKKVEDERKQREADRQALHNSNFITLALLALIGRR